MGYLGYGLRHFTLQGGALARQGSDLPDLFFAFFDVVVGYDHHDDVTYVISTGLPDSGSARIERAERRLTQVLNWIDASGVRRRPRPPSKKGAPVIAVLDPAYSALTKDEYVRMIRRAKAYIAAGDVYQVNLAQRFRLPFSKDPAALFQVLKATNPAPFGAYIRGRGWSVISASPERFLSYDGRRVETRPIKGTRPRAALEERDQAFADELLTSVKDRAEHVMIVDVERNDLGRFCRHGSVRVPELMTLEAHPTVWHLVSSVVGEPVDPEGIVQGLRAAFPGGSITGAPKIRAMEIIDELEPVPRGVYTGSIGYLGVGGRVDFNVAIRTLTVGRGHVTFHVGGGVVADSDPEAEYQETLDKGLGIAKALAELG